MNYAILNQSKPEHFMNEGDLVCIMPTRKVEAGTDMIRVQMQTNEYQFVALVKKEEITPITKEVADIMLNLQ